MACSGPAHREEELQPFISGEDAPAPLRPRNRAPLRSCCTSWVLFGFVVLLSFALYGAWALGYAGGAPLCPRGPFRNGVSDCFFQLFILIPSSILFFLAFVWHLFDIAPFNDAKVAIRNGEFIHQRNLKMSLLWLLKLSCHLYLLLYPAAYSLFHVIIKTPHNFYGPVFFGFATRQSGLFICVFYIVRNWFTRRYDQSFIRFYWCILAVVYLFQLMTLPPRMNYSWASTITWAASIPHILLVVHAFAQRRLMRAVDSPLLDTQSQGADEVFERDLLVALAASAAEQQRLVAMQGETDPPPAASESASSLVLQAAKPQPSTSPGADASKPLSSLGIFRVAVVLAGQFFSQFQGSGKWGVCSFAISIFAGVAYGIFEMQALAVQGSILGGSDSAVNDTATPLATSTTAASALSVNISSSMLLYLMWLSLQNFSWALQRFCSSATRYLLANIIRPKLMKMLFHESKDTAMYCMQTQVPTLEDRLSELLENLFTPVCQLVTSFLFLVKISLPLTGVLLAASSVYVLSVVAKIFVVAWLSHRREANSAALNDAASQAHKDRAVAPFAKGVASAVSEYLRLAAWESGLVAIDLTACALVTISTLWFGASLTATPGELSLQDFISFALISSAFTTALNNCATACTTFVNSYATVAAVAGRLAGRDSAPAVIAQPDNDRSEYTQDELLKAIIPCLQEALHSRVADGSWGASDRQKAIVDTTKLKQKCQKLVKSL